MGISPTQYRGGWSLHTVELEDVVAVVLEVVTELTSLEV